MILICPLPFFVFLHFVCFSKGEDGFDRNKFRSKECNYCGKSFRSSYYLTVHLRTHTGIFSTSFIHKIESSLSDSLAYILKYPCTGRCVSGEKPYKCAYCDYAAAQKTSLKYHLDRRHKGKPYVDIPIRPAPLVSSPTDEKHGDDGENPAPNRPKLWVPGATLHTTETPEDSFDSIGSTLGKPLVPADAECEKSIAKSGHTPTDDAFRSPVPVNLKIEEIKDEIFEAPLNLSLKVSLSVPASAEPRSALIPAACSFCAYKTMYPEVLMMHKRLNHKDKTDGIKKNRFEGSLKRRRLTGCPPALDGKDVTPLPMFERQHPRRTKSPVRPPAKPQEKMPVNPPPAPKQSPVHAPVHDAVQEAQRHRRRQTDTPPSQEPRFTELFRKSSMGSKYVMERPGPAGIGERSYPARSGVIWHSDAARLCLSSGFGSLPQIDFGEPSSKRLKYAAPPGREADTGEKHCFRGPAGDGSSRLLIPGRSVKTPSQGSTSSSASENLGSLKTASTAIGGGLDSEWSMMNLLRSYAPNDLASFYHSTPTNPSHGGLANPRAGM